MYSVNELSKLSGVSRRTLRYYEELGLLKPKRAQNDYRVYESNDVDQLQLILFYRELGYPLKTIHEIIHSKDFNMEKSLRGHLNELEERQKQLGLLIENVKTTLKSIRGESIMTDKKKFEAFKGNLVDENEKKYGKEVREMYGEASINYANDKILNMTEEECTNIETLSENLYKKLKKAAEIGDPSSDLAQEVVQIHRKWMSFFMENSDCPEAQIAMTEMYVNDERFKAYYDNIFQGSAEFLRDAVKNYCSGN